MLSEVLAAVEVFKMLYSYNALLAFSICSIWSGDDLFFKMKVLILKCEHDMSLHLAIYLSCMVTLSPL